MFIEELCRSYDRSVEDLRRFQEELGIRDFDDTNRARYGGLYRCQEREKQKSHEQRMVTSPQRNMYHRAISYFRNLVGKNHRQ